MKARRLIDVAALVQRDGTGVVLGVKRRFPDSIALDPHVIGLPGTDAAAWKTMDPVVGHVNMVGVHPLCSVIVRFDGDTALPAFTSRVFHAQ